MIDYKNDIDWCNIQCDKKGLRLFGNIKLEAICERISIMIESGVTENNAREIAFKYYING